MVTPIKFEVSSGYDTTSVKLYHKYTLHGWYFKEKGKGLIEYGSVNSAGVGSCGFTGAVITNDDMDTWKAIGKEEILPDLLL